MYRCKTSFVNKTCKGFGMFIMDKAAASTTAVVSDSSAQTIERHKPKLKFWYL